MSELFDELRVALYAIWHRRWLALAVTWAVCLLGWLVIAMVPNSYESKARIYVNVDDVLSEQLDIAGDGQKEITRVRQTLASAKNLEKVITSTKLGENITERSQLEAAIESLTDKVEVSSEEDNLFQISATIGKSNLSDAENALLARNVVQKLLDIFREEHISGNRADINKAISELDEQLAERKAELEAAEQRRLEFETQYPELVGGSDTLSSQVRQSRTDSRDLEADLAAAQSSLAAIESQLAGTPKTLTGTAAGDPTGPRAALQQAQTLLAELRGRGLKDGHPDVRSAQKQVQILQRQVAAAGPNAVSSTPNPAYSSLLAIKADRQAAVEALQARRAAIQANAATLMASRAAEPAVAAEANRISRDYDVLRENYEKLLQDREAIRTRGEVDDNSSQFRFDLIDPPVVPQKPAAPNRPVLLLGVLFAGLAAGAGAAFAVSLLRSTFSTSDKLEKTFDLPVIGSISLAVSDAAKAVERRRFKQFAGACAGLVCVFVVLLAIEMVTVGTVA